MFNALGKNIFFYADWILENVWDHEEFTNGDLCRFSHKLASELILLISQNQQCGRITQKCQSCYHMKTCIVKVKLNMSQISHSILSNFQKHLQNSTQHIRLGINTVVEHVYRPHTEADVFNI